MTASDVDAFLRAGWGRKPGTAPLTVDDYWFAMLRHFPDLTRGEVIAMFAGAAARAGFGQQRKAA